MRLFALARHPTRLIRLALLASMLTLGLNALAHAAHSHANSNAADTVACGYCVTFGGIAGTPQHASSLILANPATESRPVASTGVAIGAPARSPAQPRAPPIR